MPHPNSFRISVGHFQHSKTMTHPQNLEEVCVHVARLQELWSFSTHRYCQRQGGQCPTFGRLGGSQHGNNHPPKNTPDIVGILWYLYWVQKFPLRKEGSAARVEYWVAANFTCEGVNQQCFLRQRSIRMGSQLYHLERIDGDRNSHVVGLS